MCTFVAYGERWSPAAMMRAFKPCVAPVIVSLRKNSKREPYASI
jgi:hypothetical protein